MYTTSNRLIAFMFNMRNGIADELLKSDKFITDDIVLYSFDSMIRKSYEITKERKVLYQIPAGSVCKCDELSCSHNFDGECAAIRALSSEDLEIYSDGSCSLYEYCAINGIVYPDLDEIEKITNERLEDHDKEFGPEKKEG